MASESLRPSDEDTVELGWYFRALQRRWKLAAAGALVGGGLAFGFASIQPLLYEGVTTLLVVPPAQPSGAQINPATFRAIVENASLASQVISELKLGEGENAVTPLTFLERALRVEDVRGTNIVRVKVTLRDPGRAAEASRRLASKAIVLTQQISQQDGATIQGQLKNHLSDAQQRLTGAEKDLLAYKQGAQVELLKEDADAQLKERGDLLRLVVDIEAEKARLASALNEIKRQQPLLTATRMPGAEDALRRADADAKAARDKAREKADADAKAARDKAREKADADAKAAGDKTREKVDEPNDRKSAADRPGEVNAQHLDLSDAHVNPVYQTLDFQIATSRNRIAALEKERDELVNVKKIGGKELSLLTELYRRQIEEGRLQANFDLAERVYGDLAVRFEQSRTQPLGSTAQLQVIDDAQPPERPVSRKRLLYGMFGAAAGLGIAVMLALLRDNRGPRI